MRTPRNRWRLLWPLALVGLIGLHFWFPAVPSGNTNNTFSVGEEGKKAFYLMVDDLTDSSTRNLESIESFCEGHFGETLCLLGPSREPTDEEWSALLDWVADYDGNLVYAVSYDAFRRVAVVGEEEPESLTLPRIGITVEQADVDVLGEFASPFEQDLDRLTWRTSAEIEVEDENVETLLTVDGSVQAVRIVYGTGRIVVVATDEPFTNYQLLAGDGGVFGHRLLETAGLGSLVVFDESLNESSTPKMVGVLFDRELRPLTVQLMIGTLLFAWWGSERFGPVLPPRLPPQKDVVGHSDAMGMLVHQNGDGAGALRAYYNQLLAEVGLGKGSAGRTDRLLGPIARRLEVSLDRVKDVLRDARDATQRKQLSRREAAMHIRRLAKIRRATGVTTRG